MKGNNKNNQSNQSILSSSLFQLCSTQSTGTVFISTSRNTSAQIVLQDSAIVAFSFENKHGVEAIESFKQATFTRSQFIENYQFPLTNAANISSSDLVLTELGFNEFLIDQTTQCRKQFHFECVNPSLFAGSEPSYAM